MTAKNGHAKYISLHLLTMFWAAQTISLFGDRLNNFSLAALINKFAANPGLTLSKIYLAMYLPIFTLAPVIGVLIDRLNKRWVLVVTDVFRCVLVILVPVLFMRTGSFLPIMAVVFLLTTGNLFFVPAKSGLIPELVPPERLIRVNSILWAAGIAGVIGGFLGGGLIFDYLSWPMCFYLDGATYMVSALLLVGIALKDGNTKPVARKVKTRHPPLLTAVRKGLEALKKSPGILRPMGIQSLVFFGAGGFSILAIVLIRDASPPDSSLGLSIAGLSIGLGMGTSSVLVNRISRERREQVEAGCFILFVPAAAAIFSDWGFPAIGTGSFIAGLSASPLVIISESVLQEKIAPDQRGVLFSFREILTRSLFLISAFLFSALGELIDKGTLLILLGLFLATAGMVWIGFTDRTSKR